MFLQDAHDWLVRREKHPIRDEGGFWRWVLPDPATSDAMEELPKVVFDRLPGWDNVSPWRYRTRDRAMMAAVWAAEGAMQAGFRPGRLP